MSEHTRMALMRRIAREHRSLVLPLALLLVVNVLLYAAFIYPLARRVSNVAERTQAAEAELAAARLAQVRAAAAVRARSEASEELATFYGAVLPATLPEARRLMFPRLARLAREMRLKPAGADVDLEKPRLKETLTQLRVRMELTGSYADIREFIHRLERAEDFTVIDSIGLTEALDNAPLTVQVELSTYFQAEAS